ncbi:MAG: hypothetical protein XD78_0522 [Desulfotomaculum sp. 46_296]|nr:MAG: hypothetical protein XD78_0522 [Desulfotomaculum sp. 46_296]HAU31071.1 hypothetical protein [Desulfotomaculum sp.]
MNCPNCQQNLQNDFKFCPYCENTAVKKVSWEACFPPERNILTGDIALRHISAGEVTGPF